MSRFVPETPHNPAAVIAPRVGAHHCLYYDAGSRVALPSPYGDGRTFYHTRADWSEGVSWVRFTVNGHAFTRRAREVQVGNFGVTWVRIAGQDYQIHEDIGLLG
jgi:hypothetical protein